MENSIQLDCVWSAGVTVLSLQYTAAGERTQKLTVSLSPLMSVLHFRRRVRGDSLGLVIRCTCGLLSYTLIVPFHLLMSRRSLPRVLFRRIRHIAAE